MPIFCPACASEMPDSAAFCPGCGCAMRPAEPPLGSVGLLPQSLAGAMAYFFLPAIAFLCFDPYRKSRFVRFHSFQSLGLFLSALALGAMLRIASFALFFVPTLGRLLILLVSMVVILAFVAVWGVLVIKAMQGEMLELPVIGDYAARRASVI